MQHRRKIQKIKLSNDIFLYTNIHSLKRKWIHSSKRWRTFQRSVIIFLRLYIICIIDKDGAKIRTVWTWHSVHHTNIYKARACTCDATDTFRERYDEALVASVIHGSCTSYRIKRSPSCRDLWTFALLLAGEIDRLREENGDRKRI